jgi:ferrous iron transport protein B
MTCKDCNCAPGAMHGPAGNISIALVGNPNCGKTTLFNNLTGTRQRVGNWPGVTVDRKQGLYKDTAGQIDIIDLPGIYTLGAIPGTGENSIDETVARDFIVSEQVDVLVNIVNAANLERNLYLTAQLIEMNLPMIVVLNMMDTAQQAGLNVSAEVLSEKLGLPVVSMSAIEGKNNFELVNAIRASARAKTTPTSQLPYTAALQSLVEKVANDISDDELAPPAENIDRKWLAVRLIEGDTLACSLVGRATCQTFRARVKALEAECGEDADILVADGRFTFANDVANASVSKVFEVKRSTSDAIDQLVLHRVTGPLVFLAAIYAMFMFTINLGGAFIDFFDQATGAIFVDGTRALATMLGLPEWLKVIFADGIGGGIQVVATFIPIMGFLYLFLSFLEDSGYMARAAFLMDALMRKIGLPGKAFVPLIVGFGCNVPAIMASRTLEKQQDRILTTVMSPFMSCGARLTIYALFTAAFFPTGGTNIVFLLYVIGILAALLTGFMLKKTILKGETTPFIMELPPYRMPRLKDLFYLAWVRLKGFVFGAGQIIIIVVAILSVVNSLGTDGSFNNQGTDKSLLAAIGRTITPAFAPIGMTKENWPAAVGLFTGVFAKEAVVGTLNSLYAGQANHPATASAPAPTPAPPLVAVSISTKLLGALKTIPQNLAALGRFITDPLGVSAAKPTDVSNGTFGAMVKHFDGKIGAFAYLLFILLYFPCLAAISAVVTEAGRKWAAFAGLWSTGLAYFVSVVFYQGATFFRHPQTSLLWIGLVSAAMAAFIVLLKRQADRQPASPAPATAQ